MSDIVPPSHETLLKACAALAPQPWYPREYTKATGIARDIFDEVLNDLRIGGLLQLTEWEKSTGQGYLVTDLGKEVLNNPTLMDDFKASLKVPIAEGPTPAKLPASQLTPLERGDLARDAYYRPHASQVMPVLLILNLLAFGMSFVLAIRMGKPLNDFALSGNAEVLRSAGALTSVDLVKGEWWRLMTCCFLHFGLLHLGMNMYALYASARLESLWGSARFLIIYLAAGLGGSCTAMIYNAPQDHITLAGASGAIWGLMMSLVAWMLLNRGHIPPREMAAWLREYAFVIVLMVIVSTLPNVSASAHLGGGAVGFIMAVLLFFHRFSTALQRTLFAFLIVLLPVLCVVALLEVMERDRHWRELDQSLQAVEKPTSISFSENVVPNIDKFDTNIEPIRAAVPGGIALEVRMDDMNRLIGNARVLREKIEMSVTGSEAEEAARLAGREYVEAFIDFGKLLDGPLGFTLGAASPLPTRAQEPFRRLENAKKAWDEKRSKL